MSEDIDENDEVISDKKKTKNRRFSITVISVFMGILLFPTLAWGLLSLIGKVNKNIIDKVDFDLGEKRDKATFPNTFHLNTFTSELEAYYNDHAPFRAIIISANTKISEKIERPYKEVLRPAIIKWFFSDEQLELAEDLENEMDLENFFAEEVNSEIVTEESDKDSEHHNDVVLERMEASCTENGSITYECSDCHRISVEEIKALGHKGQIVKITEASYEDYGYTLYECMVCKKEYRDDFKNKLIDNSYFPPNIFYDRVLEGRLNWLFYAGDNNIAYYKGENILSDEIQKTYLSLMKELKSICDKKGIQLQFMIIPNKEQIYWEYMPTYTISNTYKRVDRFVDYVKENSDINIIYPINELKAAKKYWQIYYKYDTHWNNMGAFVGVQSLYKALDIPMTNPLNVEAEEVKKQEGDLVSLGNLDPNNYCDDINYNVIYKPEIHILQNRGDKIGIGSGTYHSMSDSENINNLVLLSDSYRTAMIPFLEKDFLNCTITHRDNVNHEDIVEAIKKADILVITAVERFDSEIIEAVEAVIIILSEKD